MRAIRGDLGRLGRAAVLLEVADHAVVERQPNEPLYHLLLGAPAGAGAAATGRSSWPASCSSCWRWKACSPTSTHCIGCGATEDLVAFDLGRRWRALPALPGGAGRVGRGARRDARHRRRPAPHGDRPAAVSESPGASSMRRSAPPSTTSSGGSERPASSSTGSPIPTPSHAPDARGRPTAVAGGWSGAGDRPPRLGVVEVLQPLLAAVVPEDVARRASSHSGWRTGGRPPPRRQTPPIRWARSPRTSRSAFPPAPPTWGRGRRARVPARGSVRPAPSPCVGGYLLGRRWFGRGRFGRRSGLVRGCRLVDGRVTGRSDQGRGLGGCVGRSLGGRLPGRHPWAPTVGASVGASAASGTARTARPRRWRLEFVAHFVESRAGSSA